MNDNIGPSSDRNAGADFRAMAITAARLADAKKAEDIRIYDAGKRSPLTDFLLVATVDNPAQLEAVEEEISVAFKKDGFYAGHRDGGQSRHWRVLDYGGLIVHLFEKAARESFSFDSIYSDYPTVKWQARPARSGNTGKKVRRPAAARKPAARKPAVRKPAARKKAVKRSPRSARK
ncbi:MAG TPA: ribosome silencing factor [Elusimicrobiales bacterium]|nr:ribosome silencing factor [Elusimicrobiales bacterium]